MLYSKELYLKVTFEIIRARTLHLDTSLGIGALDKGIREDFRVLRKTSQNAMGAPQVFAWLCTAYRAFTVFVRALLQSDIFEQLKALQIRFSEHKL